MPFFFLKQNQQHANWHKQFGSGEADAKAVCAFSELSIFIGYSHSLQAVISSAQRAVFLWGEASDRTPHEAQSFLRKTG